MSSPGGRITTRTLPKTKIVRGRSRSGRQPEQPLPPTSSANAKMKPTPRGVVKEHSRDQTLPAQAGSLSAMFFQPRCRLPNGCLQLSNYPSSARQGLARNALAGGRAPGGNGPSQFHSSSTGVLCRYGKVERRPAAADSRKEYWAGACNKWPASRQGCRVTQNPARGDSWKESVWS